MARTFIHEEPHRVVATYDLGRRAAWLAHAAVLAAGLAGLFALAQILKANTTARELYDPDAFHQERLRHEVVDHDHRADQASQLARARELRMREGTAVDPTALAVADAELAEVQGLVGEALEALDAARAVGPVPTPTGPELVVALACLETPVDPRGLTCSGPGGASGVPGLTAAAWLDEAGVIDRHWWGEVAWRVGLEAVRVSGLPRHQQLAAHLEDAGGERRRYDPRTWDRLHDRVMADFSHWPVVTGLAVQREARAATVAAHEAHEALARLRTERLWGEVVGRAQHARQVRDARWWGLVALGWMALAVASLFLPRRRFVLELLPHAVVVDGEHIPTDALRSCVVEDGRLVIRLRGRRVLRSPALGDEALLSDLAARVTAAVPSHEDRIEASRARLDAALQQQALQAVIARSARG